MSHPLFAFCGGALNALDTRKLMGTMYIQFFSQNVYSFAGFFPFSLGSPLSFRRRYSSCFCLFAGPPCP